MGDGDPVVGARATSKFVEDDQRAFCRTGNYLRGFSQLFHERTAPFVDVVWSPHPDNQSDKEKKKRRLEFFVMANVSDQAIMES